MDQSPAVSVVIPTRDRPALVVRAVRSALAQSLVDIEVIVVIDGLDLTTVDALSIIRDNRLVTVCLPSSVGGAEARNIGAWKSRSPFVAFLDDDDEWYPEKLERQLECVEHARKKFPVVTCRLIARRPNGDEIWPARRIRPGESMCEYLLCREESIRQGEGFIQTSTLLVPRTLLLQVPFRCDLRRHQDWDWLIRAYDHPEVEVLWAWEPLVVYHIDTFRKSISAGRSLKPSLNWINENRLVTPKAKAYFYATQIAVRCDTLPTFFLIVLNTLRYPRAFAIAMGLALVPRGIVGRLRQRSALSHA